MAGRWTLLRKKVRRAQRCCAGQHSQWRVWTQQCAAVPACLCAPHGREATPRRAIGVFGAQAGMCKHVYPPALLCTGGYAHAYAAPRRCCAQVVKRMHMQRPGVVGHRRSNVCTYTAPCVVMHSSEQRARECGSPDHCTDLRTAQHLQAGHRGVGGGHGGWRGALHRHAKVSGNQAGRPRGRVHAQCAAGVHILCCSGCRPYESVCAGWWAGAAEDPAQAVLRAVVLCLAWPACERAT